MWKTREAWMHRLTSTFAQILVLWNCSPLHVLTGGCSARRRAPGLSVRYGSVRGPGGSGLFIHLSNRGPMLSSVMRTRVKLRLGPWWIGQLVQRVLRVGCRTRLFIGRYRFLSFGYLCFLLEARLSVTRIASSVCSSTYVQHTLWDAKMTIVEGGLFLPLPEEV